MKLVMSDPVTSSVNTYLNRNCPTDAYSLKAKVANILHPICPFAASHGKEIPMVVLEHLNKQIKSVERATHSHIDAGMQVWNAFIISTQDRICLASL